MEKKTILCIDDEQTGLLVRKMMLEAEGYNVMTAESGSAGLAILAASPVDAIILDFEMPGMNGAEVAREVRNQWPHVPILMLTGFPDDVSRDALHLFNAFIVKGGAPEQLFALIDQALHGQYSDRLTVLVVDDNDQHRYALSRVLKQAGFRVLEAATGRDALYTAHSRPSLIILDINLPDMLGFDVCKLLKEDAVTREIPVIHISATYPQQDIVSQSRNSGAAHFIEYPQDMAELMKIVQQEVHTRAVGSRDSQLKPDYAAE